MNKQNKQIFIHRVLIFFFSVGGKVGIQESVDISLLEIEELSFFIQEAVGNLTVGATVDVVCQDMSDQIADRLVL